MNFLKLSRQQMLKMFLVKLQPMDIYKETPFEYRDDISADIGVPIFIKREDKIDSLGCGHKLRKISYLASYATQRQATMLVSVGSLPSNQCKTVSVVAIKQGLKSHFIYGGDHQNKPSMAYGNYLITTLLQPKVSWFENTSWRNLKGKVEEIVALETKNGEKPFVIMPGASQWPGLLGSIEMGFELAMQARANNVEITDIVAVAGSGGTCIGLKIVAEALSLSWRVHGICIGEPSSMLNGNMLEMKRNFYTQTDKKIDTHGVNLFDGALGDGYDNPTDEELECMKHALQNYGLILDPNYMVKMFIGLKKIIDAGVIDRSCQVALIHSGGQTGIFDNGLGICNWYKKNHSEYLS